MSWHKGRIENICIVCRHLPLCGKTIPISAYLDTLANSGFTRRHHLNPLYFDAFHFEDATDEEKENTYKEVYHGLNHSLRQSGRIRNEVIRATGPRYQI
jgi:hypothetical protein